MCAACGNDTMDDMITVKNLTKRYGDYVAVDDVSFTCRPGQVTGFLGPNGAGKSTTMRIIAGLTPPTSGVAQLYGVDYRAIPNPATQVGILLDASAQHAGRTGAEVLRLSAMTMGIGRDRVDEMLELVSLTPEEAGRRVRNYSLGMRQRLGIAAALLGDPKILILDEPANGLDPAGIHWMRTLLRGYADRGGTVLLSSHLLHEIEIVADDIVVIGNGRIVAQGTKDELLAGAGTRVRSLDDAALGEALVAAGITVQRNTSGGLDVDADPVDVGRAAVAVGVVLTELRPADGAQLEAMFLQLTAETQREHTTLEGAAR
ncbi:Daunorubicin/doxorubicin resistance ATP-binding protein DrrA [Gordonia terrae]|nr:transporter [Clostridioides difficile]VTS54300.1 Daunorubicin/doxorubicin resistance ATP-binding protein DrrA [Gordonia terrae]